MTAISPSHTPAPSIATTTTPSAPDGLTPTTTNSTSHYANPPQPSTNNTTSSTTNDFAFPPHYSFPPFFTLQPILTTRTSQLQSWSTLIQLYCRHHHLFSLSLISALETPLFHNRTLSRRLSLRDARTIIDWMCSAAGDLRAEWLDAPSSKKKTEDETAKNRFWVFWKRPEEWASVIEEWVDGTGQKGVVLTLYEIVESDATRREEFHGMEEGLLRRCLDVCVRRGRAQVFGQGDGLGVKFF